MDLLESLRQCLEPLLLVPIRVGESRSLDVKKFEEKYCFLREFQPHFRADDLTTVLQRINSHTIYEFCDILDIRFTLFLCQERPVLIGPYVCYDWDDTNGENLLIQAGIPSANYMEYKYYYCSFPVLDSSFVLKAARAFLSGAGITSSEYSYYKVSAETRSSFSEIDIKKEYYFAPVEQRYQLEADFFNAIKEGNVEKALEFLTKLRHLPATFEYGVRNSSNYTVGASILRTLSRTAARFSGLSPVIIDTICQQYAQKLRHYELHKDIKKIQHLTENMVIDLCQSVRNYHCQNYTPAVHKVVHYIHSNLSHNLTAASIAAEFHLSPDYLSKQMKESTGLSITKFIMRERLNKAAILLLSTDYLVQNISNYVGYSDNNYFVKIFKKHYEMTPTAYRNKYSS